MFSELLSAAERDITKQDGINLKIALPIREVFLVGFFHWILEFCVKLLYVKSVLKDVSFIVLESAGPTGNCTTQPFGTAIHRASRRCFGSCPFIKNRGCNKSGALWSTKYVTASCHDCSRNNFQVCLLFCHLDRLHTR